VVPRLARTVVRHLITVVFWRKCDKSPSTRTGRAKPVTHAREKTIETSGPAALCGIGL